LEISFELVWRLGYSGVKQLGLLATFLNPIIIFEDKKKEKKIMTKIMIFVQNFDF